MKPYYSLLLVLLFTLSFTAIIYADTSQIGPGIDTSKGSALYFGPQTYDMYPLGDIYIEFNAPVNATYTFYIGWGTVEQHAKGYIQFELTDNNNNYIKDITITFSDGVEFHTEELFSVYLAKGTYKLWIKPSFEDGSLMLWGYDASTDPSVSYYNHPQYGWTQLEDLAWYALYSTSGGGGSGGAPTTPCPRAVYDPESIWSDDKYVYVKITIWNWKNGTTITVYRYDEILDTYTDKQEFTVEYVGKQTIIAKFSRINGGEESGDYIYISGYDLNGNFYSTRLEPFNVTVTPKGWLDIVMEWFQALYSYAGLAFATVKAIIPYAGVFYFLALLGSFIQCIKDVSIQPLFDFFYKQYSMLMGLASLTIKIAEKVYNGIKMIAQAIITAIASLI
ncbi:MAG: hypothetical protein J7J82_07520 [Staphylothermus sp.]|nr:hypothetical protein [Staphylothermus sp.]